MGCRARSSRQANETELVGDVQCSSYPEVSIDEMIGPESSRFRSYRGQLGTYRRQEALSSEDVLTEVAAAVRGGTQQ